MVQGLPAVDWKNADNNTKLFAAVLASCGNLNNSKIAEVFGPHVPGSAISYRLNVIRKDGAALGVTAGAGSITTSIKANGTKKRATPATKQNKPKGKGRKLGGFLNDGQSDDTKSAVDDGSEGMVSFAETEDENASTTPAPKRQKTLSGRVTKRVSPRKGQKTDYKKLDDPFVTMANAEDDDGENIFGAPSATNSEDTYATDGSFEDKEAGVDAGEKAVIKMEEAY